MYPNRMRFCLLLKFLDERQAKFQIHLGDEKINFEVENGQMALRGTVNCFENGFPIEYETVHSLSPEQIKTCECLIHSGVAFAIPQLLLAGGLGNVWFTHAFPAHVTPASILMISHCTYFHSESPNINLAIRD